MKQNNNILYIGLNGWAGSGKDTVAKALAIMLDNNFSSYDEFKKYYDEFSGYETKTNFKYATFGNLYNVKNDTRVMCIAFADRLKQICSDLFGVPIERFYYNKENAYICINKDFKYTEQIPYDGELITSEQYYWDNDKYSNVTERYYMSLREILVYVGTYVVQNSINKYSFINSVKNTVNSVANKNDNLNYIICTDVRFQTEFNFIQNMHGVIIHIERPGLEQLNNIAEKALTDEDENEFDFTIVNDGTYDDLFKKLWNIINNNHIFSNETYKLDCRDNSNNYIRKINSCDGEEEITFELCNEYPLSSANMSGDKLNMIDPQGGPMIVKDDELVTIGGTVYYVDSIEQHANGETIKFYINTYSFN